MTDETAKSLADAMNRLAAALEAQDRYLAEHPVVAPIGRTWASPQRPAFSPSAPFPFLVPQGSTS